MSTITALSPMLEVSSLRDSMAWYQQQLDFVLQDHLPELGWASLVRDEVRIMIVSRATEKTYPRPVFTGSLYLYTDDVDAWWDRLRNTVQIEYPLETFAYGMREFAFRDLNGYLWQIGTYAAG